MNTQPTSKKFNFKRFGKRRVEAALDGGAMTTDAGSLLLQKVDDIMGSAGWRPEGSSITATRGASPIASRH